MQRLVPTARRILAVYHIEASQPLEEAAAIRAGQRSSSTFVPVPGETDALRQRTVPGKEASPRWYPPILTTKLGGSSYAFMDGD